jgi:hypothetical protein
MRRLPVIPRERFRQPSSPRAGGRRRVRAEGRTGDGMGQAAFIPRGVPHAFRIESEQARWLVINNPAGFERFLRAAGEPAPADELPPPGRAADPGAVAQVAAEYGIEVLGAPGTLPGDTPR